MACESPHWQSVVDDRTGIVCDLSPLDVPEGAQAWRATLCETGWFGSMSGAPSTAGCSWNDTEQAQAAAVGEAVERYGAHLVDPSRLRRACWHDLHDAGEPALDPAALALYHPSQLQQPGFPFAGCTRTDPVDWVLGHSRNNFEVWVPAAIVWLTDGPHQHNHSDGRPVCLPVNAGLGAGHDPSQAQRAAFGEVVERHCLAQAWHGHAPLPLLRGVRAFTPDPHAMARFELRAVPNRWGAAVVLAVRRHHGCVTFGCALGEDWQRAAAKAASEAVMVTALTNQLAEGLAEWERSMGGLLAPHMADRRYLDSYRCDQRDIVDIVCHLQLLLDPRVQAAVDARLRQQPSPDLAPSSLWDVGCQAEVDACQPAPSLAQLQCRMATDGLEPVTVDLTSSDVASAGWCVHRVVVPGLRATGPAAFPYLGDGAEPLPPDPCREVMPHV